MRTNRRIVSIVILVAGTLGLYLYSNKVNVLIAPQNHLAETAKQLKNGAQSNIFSKPMVDVNSFQKLNLTQGKTTAFSADLVTQAFGSAPPAEIAALLSQRLQQQKTFDMALRNYDTMLAEYNNAIVAQLDTAALSEKLSSKFAELRAIHDDLYLLEEKLAFEIKEKLYLKHGIN